jgi:hypothetical protein
MIPEISASKVASIIGMHAYQSVDSIMYDLFCKDRVVKLRINEIEKRHARSALNAVKNQVLADSAINTTVAIALEQCKTATDLTSIMTNVESQAKLALGLRFPTFTPEVRDLMVSEVRGAVNQRRGLANENTILNTYEEDTGREVSQRNTKTFKKDFGDFKLIGRTDGHVESLNRIVDSKDRTRKWKTVPIYDEIQLRVYMNMANATDSELVERFPDGTKRNTVFLNDPVRWTLIEDGVRTAVGKMNSILEDDEEELKRIVFANSVAV